MGTNGQIDEGPGVRFTKRLQQIRSSRETSAPGKVSGLDQRSCQRTQRNETCGPAKVCDRPPRTSPSAGGGPGAGQWPAEGSRRLAVGPPLMAVGSVSLIGGHRDTVAEDGHWVMVGGTPPPPPPD